MATIKLKNGNVLVKGGLPACTCCEEIPQCPCVSSPSYAWGDPTPWQGPHTIGRNYRTQETFGGSASKTGSVSTQLPDHEETFWLGDELLSEFTGTADFSVCGVESITFWVNYDKDNSTTTPVNNSVEVYIKEADIWVLQNVDLYPNDLRPVDQVPNPCANVDGCTVDFGTPPVATNIVPLTRAGDGSKRQFTLNLPTSECVYEVRVKGHMNAGGGGQYIQIIIVDVT